MLRPAKHRSLLPIRKRILTPIRNFLWPSSLLDLVGSILTVAFITVTKLSIFESCRMLLWGIGDYIYIQDDRTNIENQLKLSVVLGTLIFAGLVYIRKVLLRILLAYRGWLYEPPKNTSKWTIAWMLSIRVLGGWKPSTYSCQSSLPRMHVPLLSSTIRKFMKSVKPVLSKDEYEQIKKEGKEFTKSQGTSLQFMLNLKAWWSPSYVSDWWEKYAYLASRSPLPINSNFYGLDNFSVHATGIQTARAGAIVHFYLLFMLMLENGQIPATMIQNAIPLCMNQYKRCFSSARVPGEEIDEIIHVDISESKFFVVNRKGVMYKVDMFDSNGELLSPKSIQDQLEWIIDDAERHQYAATSMASLTGLQRSDWAQVRKQYLATGANEEILRTVENAAIYITLDERCPQDSNEQAQFSMCGDCKTCWFDKSQSLIFFGNGRYSMNVEHTWGDALVAAHVSEWAMVQELDNVYDESGNCKPPENAKLSTVSKPTILQWQVNDDLNWHIKRAFNFLRTNNEDCDVVVTNFDEYGKGFVKKQKISPDAYLQLAYQLAYFQNTGKTPLTYESSMTRLFLHGRTETIRSATPASVAFVKAMVQNHHSREQKISLLKKAAQTHSLQYKESMTGKACDRHLFALYIMCKALHRESPFLKHALSLPFTLSTSQTPQNQVKKPPYTMETRNKASPGGGFGPTSDQGYGISYMCPEDSRFFFHVSSKRSCPDTDSTKFSECIFTALRDMRHLLEG
ncbi:carnitine O-palmitoyltransferase 1, liver isoform-like [Anneissia japonica]|uniref:carnitine O-palmitoyltransferase 1, liver isoform-like n=1 Tax=Anneissia japonica TaxID=1529436 RepID=UPI0014258B85|nr:carnitine O-palmitoyltransferase 1, liver isoform-like [Anneissia japonica]